VTLPAQSTWFKLNELPNSRVEPIKLSIRVLLEQHPYTNIDHEPEWLAVRARSAGTSVREYVCLHSEQDRVVGYAPFFVHPSSFTFSLASFDLLTYRTRRVSLTCEPLLVGDETEQAALMLALLKRVGSDLSGREIAFGLGVRLDSPFGRVLQGNEVPTRFIVMPYGPEYKRRLAAIPGSLAEYLARLGSKTRQDLRRQERRLSEESAGDVTVTVHCSPDSVPEFLTSAEIVSRRTYQWNLLGMGVGNTQERRELLTLCAQNGWFRGYILRCRGIPVAFMVGYLYRSVYYSDSIGYDPKWAAWSVGNVLHLRVMRELAGLGGEVRWFDFLHGDNANKERLSTDARLERNFYLVPRTAGWTTLISALRLFDAVTARVAHVLDRLGVKTRLRKLLRARSTRATSG
jgi:CelD/BcsL family acetyltransferase involved in cellulose biosynthesis